MRREVKVNSGIDIAQEEFHRNLAWKWQCKATHKLKTGEQITKFGWTVLPHSPNSPGLSPSRFPPVWSPEGWSLWHEFESLIRTTQVWKLGNKSQNLTGQCYPIPSTVLVCHPQDFHLFGALKDAVCDMNLRVWFALWALCYKDRMWHGIDKAYIHLFLRARPRKWVETLWKKRVWT